MIELDELESKYLALMQGNLSIQEFENWVYNSNWLENQLNEHEYTELISLNFEAPDSKYEIGKVLNDRVDHGKFETVKMLQLLDSIIDRDGQEGESLSLMYSLYCKGYFFLEDLGLDIGLYIAIPPSNYRVEYFHELSEEKQKELLDSVYPSAKEIAGELKNCLLSGTLTLTGEKDEERGYWQYIDKRT